MQARAPVVTRRPGSEVPPVEGDVESRCCMSSGSDPNKPPGMDSLVSDSTLPQVSNLLRRLANGNPQNQQQLAKLGMSPLSLRERLLAGEITGSSSLAAAESRSSSDLSIPFDSELQSLWEMAGAGAQQQQHQTFESSPLNPTAAPDGQTLHQMHLRQQLGAMAAALLPRSGSLGRATDSAGSAENRGAPKRRWADCLAETSSLPSSAPGSPARRTPPPGGDTSSPLGLEGHNAPTEALQDPSSSGGKAGKEIAPAENSNEWEPRVRRKKARGGAGSSANSDDEMAVSEDGVVRIKAKSMTERQRRDRISDALRRLRGAVNSHGDMATMLNEAVDLIQQQKRRIEELEMQILQQRLRQQLAGGCRTLF